jgi:hypothetical protein
VEAQVSLAVGVMAHHTRIDAAYGLYDFVKGDVMSIDHGPLGEWENGSRTWHMLAEFGTDWSVVLQDDALPVRDFRAHAAAALAVAPNTAVSFYVGTDRPRAEQVLSAVRRAENHDARWLEADHLLWGVGVAVPTAELKDLLEWADRMDRPYDERLGLWFHRQNRPIRYTWPSLVDHADGVSIQHPTKRVPGTRRAHKVGVQEDWVGGVEKIASNDARHY